VRGNVHSPMQSSASAKYKSFETDNRVATLRAIQSPRQTWLGLPLPHRIVRGELLSKHERERPSHRSRLSCLEPSAHEGAKAGSARAESWGCSRSVPKGSRNAKG
jgi:hypothetical protein